MEGFSKVDLLVALLICVHRGAKEAKEAAIEMQDFEHALIYRRIERSVSWIASGRN